MRVIGLIGAVLLALAPRLAAAQGSLVIYCGVDEAWCRAMTTTFEKQTGIHVDMTRKSAGEIYARLRAEKENPRGDIWWGGTGDPHLQAAEEGLTRGIPVAATAETARLGATAGGTVEIPHRRHLSRRARLRLQHRGTGATQARRHPLAGPT